MKLCNAPARKLARQIAAKTGGSCRDVDPALLANARTRFTKKNRSGR